MPKSSSSVQPYVGIYSDVATHCIFMRLRSELGSDFRILENIRSPASRGFVRQIDLVVFGPSSIFLVSSVGPSGVFRGSARSRFWTCVLDSGESVYVHNPLRQAPRQIKCLSSDLAAVLKDSFVPLVAFGDFSTFDELDCSSCLYASELPQYIRDHSAKRVFSHEQLRFFADRLQSTDQYLRSPGLFSHL